MKKSFIALVLFVALALALANVYQNTIERSDILPRILNTLQGTLPQTTRILDIGGGNGRILDALRCRGYDIVSIDIAPHHPNVQAYDGHHIPFPDSNFDIVLCVYVLHHVPHAPELLKEMRRVAKPGAHLLLYEDVPPSFLLSKVQAAFHYAYFKQPPDLYETAMYTPSKWVQLLLNAGWHLQRQTIYAGTWHYALQHVEFIASPISTGALNIQASPASST